MRRVLLGVAALAAALAGVTAVALESGEVIVLHTVAADGSERRTRVWVVEAEGSLWVEAATKQRPWYRDLERESEIVVVRGGGIAPFRAVPQPGAEGHRRIRALLRERYGWADWWVGLLQDTSESVAVRLEPLS